MDITITLSDKAVTGWQDFLDNVLNPSRAEQNMPPYTLTDFFQESEENAGLSRYMQMQRRLKIQQIQTTYGLTDKDIIQMAVLIQQNN